MTYCSPKDYLFIYSYLIALQAFSEVFAFGTIWGGPDKDLVFGLVGRLGTSLDNGLYCNDSSLSSGSEFF